METQLHDEWTWSTWGTGASGLGALFGPLLLAAVGLAITCWQYRCERARWPRQPWRLACGLRCLVWLLLAFILLGPGWQRVEQREVKPPVVVLRDVSRSMSVADPVRADEAGAALARFWHVPLEELQRAPPTRAATVERALAGQDQPLWRALQSCGVPRLIDFDQGTRRVVWERNGAEDGDGEGEGERAGAWPVGRPEGRGTDLTAALRTALEGEPPAAIVLLSDGRHTGRDDPREVAREAGERQIPIVAVEVGETQRQTSARVVGVHARPRVWQDEPFEIEALLAATAAPSRQLTVTLWRRSWDESGSMSEEQIEEAVCPLGDAAVPVRHVFTRREVTAGRYQYEVRVSPLAGELDLEDNRRVSPPVTVLERDRLRVLVIAGEPTWEFRHVERWLAQDETLQSSCWLQSAEEERQATGTRPLDALPATFEELQWYDVLLLLDPDADRLPDAWGEWIRRFLVEHGGGVLYQAGPSFTAGWQSRAVARGLQEVWPVELAGTAELELAGRVSSAPRGWPVRPVAAARDHPLLADWRDVGEPPRLAASPAAAGGAARLPVVFWSCPVRRVRPAARVLWEHSDPALGLTAGGRPLLVLGRYGQAQVAYLGFAGVWRSEDLRDSAGVRDRFWGRLVRWLAEGRVWEGHRRGWLQTDRDRVELGEAVTVTARWQPTGETGEPDLPAGRAEVSAVIRSPAGEQRVTLLAQPGEAGVFLARWTPRVPGLHEIRLETPGEEETAPLEVALTVELPQVEMQTTDADPPLLRELAQLSGGVSLRLEELDRLPSALPDRREVALTRHPPRPAWDRWWGLGLMVSLLGAEWWWRKRHRVV